MNDLYTSVTERIIAALETGVPPWLPPWQQDGDDGIPRNLASDKPYRGINILLLHTQAFAQGYHDHRWLTFKQAAELGARVKKGETGTPIVFFKWKEIDDADPEPDKPGRVRPLMRSFTVFNVAQIDGLPEQYQKRPRIQHWSPCERAEDILLGSGAVIRHGGNRAFYAPAQDWIQLPPAGNFLHAAAFYGTALHELTHWTGHPDRCCRPLGRQHGMDAYAFEELVAEMGAAFLCAHCGLPGQLEHASYINSWLDALRRDKRLIFIAAGKAQAASDFVLRVAGFAPIPVMEAVAA